MQKHWYIIWAVKNMSFYPSVPVALSFLNDWNDLNILSLCNAGDFGDNDVIPGVHMAARLL